MVRFSDVVMITAMQQVMMMPLTYSEATPVSHTAMSRPNSTATPMAHTRYDCLMESIDFFMITPSRFPAHPSDRTA